MSISIPPGVDFADLQLEREPVTQRLLCRPAVLAALFHANELDTLVNDEDVACWLIAELYLAHRTAGGVPDPAAEEILVEVAALQASDSSALQAGGDRVH